MAKTRRAFTGGAVATTTSSSIASSGTTNFTISAYTGWPSGSAPFFVVVEPGTPNEEKMLVSRANATDSSLTVFSTPSIAANRGLDGTSSVAHSSGAAIYPVFTAQDADEANEIASVLTSKGDLLGHGSSTFARVAVGSNNHVLVADSAQSAGVKWGQVGSDGIADDAVTAAKIAANAVDSSEIASGAVIEAKIGTGAVTAGKIGAGAVTTAKIGDGQVTTAKIGDAQVTTAKIGDGQVTNAKLASPLTIGFSNGSASAPSVYAGSDTDTGFYFDGSGGIIASNDGAKRLTITSANQNVIVHRRNTGSEGGMITFNRASDDAGGWYAAASGSGFVLYSASSYSYRLELDSVGKIVNPPTYDATGSGTTVVVDSNGVFRRQSSSIKYKKDIEDLEAGIVDNVVDGLRPVWYRTKEANGDDKETWSHIGLIAEEVHLVEPRLVKYRTIKVETDENGETVETVLDVPEPEDVDYARLSVVLLKAVQDLKAEVAELQKEVAALKKA